MFVWGITESLYAVNKHRDGNMWSKCMLSCAIELSSVRVVIVPHPGPSEIDHHILLRLFPALDSTPTIIHSRNPLPLPVPPTLTQ
jgi:hypothetical protein